ncbi:L-rhamnose/proton symporter RhaT [Flexithrix dorotheae]|uniref:L-rhamnose/proton symporter RhaT n=1 Tax=Flexithrix dorotheae TaxID=70993 RepID=UPI00037D4826|nr:L-rhamnose/proton symporter RhaT [Flexithrix dorotheae]
MIEGIIWALMAGLMLGLYALPEKFTRDFEFENTWALFFAINTFLVPNIAAFALVKNFTGIMGTIPGGVLWGMVIASFLWGIGVMMWGKAINHIGLSLGFSLFIGTIILVGSLLPFLVEGLPAPDILFTILAGIFIVLIGVMANGKAGLLRQKDEKNEDETKNGSMTTGILIAVIGGLLATGFSYANALGRPVIHEASLAMGNADWVTSVIVMYIIYFSGGVAIAIYFTWQISAKSLWSQFSTPYLGRNTMLTTIMAIFNFAASVAFAFAAFKLGKQGNTVGYAIFNTTSVAVAIVSGILTKEWIKASSRAKTYLYVGLASMVTGVVIVAVGNGL